MNDFDEDFDKYLKKIEARMWKGLAFTVIVGLVSLLILAIVYK